MFFFNKADSSKILASFEALLDESNGPSHFSFYKVFNKGKFRLLELGKCFVKEKEYDPIVGKREHFFFTKKSYAVTDGVKIFILSALNRINILEALPIVFEQNEEWLKQNKNKLNNELDVIAFFNFCNNKL